MVGPNFTHPTITENDRTKCGHTSAGKLTSTGDEPDFWKLGKGTGPVGRRGARVEYHCCSKAKRCCGDGKITAKLIDEYH